MAMMTQEEREMVRRYVLDAANQEMRAAVSYKIVSGLGPSDPIRRLGLGRQIISALSTVGVRNIGELGRASRSQLAGIRDIGKQGFDQLELAKEQADRIMSLVAPRTGDLSALVANVLAELGLGDLQDLNAALVAKVDKSPAFGDAAMRQINVAVANSGLTLLHVAIDSAPMDLELLIDGSVQEFVKKGSHSDPITLVADLSPLDETKVILLSARPARGGSTALRWHRSVTLNRGQPEEVDFDLTQAPVLSMRVDPGTHLESNTFYAGDHVKLFVEDGASDESRHIFWLLFDPSGVTEGIQELPAGHESPTTAHAELYGLDGWMDLRSRVDSELKRYLSSNDGYDWNLLHRALLPTRLIGLGDGVEWTPDRETSHATIALVALGNDGYWGMAMRPVSVVDLRPGAWALPQTEVSDNSWSPARAVAPHTEGDGPRPRDVDRVHGALSQIVFQGTAGQPIDLVTHLGNFTNAEVPMTSCTLDFGDGDKIQIEPDQLDGYAWRHTWQNPGRYDVRLTTQDLLGFSRTQNLNVVIRPMPETIAKAAPEPEEEPEPEPEPPAVMKAAVPATPAASSLSMFRRALDRWSGDAVSAVSGGDESLGVAVVHFHDVYDERVLDLFDDAIVRAFIESGNDVYERDSERFEALQDHRVPFDVERMLEIVPLAKPTHEMLAGHFQPSEAVRILQGVTTEDGEGDVPQVQVLEITPAIARYEDILERAESVEPFMSPHVFDYKLRRAEVTFEPLPDTPLYVRRAKILGFVRLHDAETYRVLGSDLIETEITDIVSAPAGVLEAGEGWNRYHRDFLHRPEDPARLHEPS
ncbi:MAG: PKD domain-containing protein [Phycisphaerales bacterium]|nr:PKD domain-containing protein [Phycisphaerales bacterium]